MIGTQSSRVLFAVISVYLVSVHAEVEREDHNVAEIREALRGIFANEKPFVSRTLEREVKEAVRDVIEETRELNDVQSFGAPQKRFLDPGAEVAFVEDFARSGGNGGGPEQVPYTQVHGDIGYMNDWVVHLEGGHELAQAVLEELGYGFHGPVTGFKDVYRASHSSTPRIHKREAVEVTQRLNDHHQVVWAEQQQSRVRVKRGVIPAVESNADAKQEGGEERVKRSVVKRSAKRASVPEGKSSNTKTLQRLKALLKRGGKLSEAFNDKLVAHQWYLYDTRVMPSLPRLDLGVIKAWALNYTGAGVKVTILDDGIDYTHDDLKANYDASVSHDFNDDDPDPLPHDRPGVINSHGTKCAGEVAMAANNGKCGVGVAYNAGIGGIRMLDGPVTDRIESEALSHGRTSGLDIAVCSWGPSDDGATVEGPKTLAKSALEQGVKEGRDGKGLIFVWASGNGGMSNDNCNCDGYASSIYTISINSASQSNKFPWYGERCASTMTSSYSSGAYSDQNIITTDLKNQCTSSFAGTSAAAPLAAGVLALALEANRNLTWRDVQHITVLSSNYDTLSQNEGWSQNALGLFVNLRFGFGLLDAGEMVTYARDWKPLPKPIECEVKASKIYGDLKSNGSAFAEIDVKECIEGGTEGVFLEHVEAVVSLNHTHRGALEVTLTSARGTDAMVLTTRKQDKSTQGFEDWPFMSVHTWGEDPRGKWRINVTDTSDADNTGKLLSAKLVLHTLSEVPKYAEKQYKHQYSFHSEAKKLQEKGN